MGRNVNIGGTTLCARGDGERMSRLMGLVGEAGTGEVRMRRSGAGDLDRGVPGQRSAPTNQAVTVTVVCLCAGAAM